MIWIENNQTDKEEHEWMTNTKRIWKGKQTLSNHIVQATLH